MHRNRITLLAVSLSLLVAAAATAGNWPNWRGPSFNGSADETNLPVKFSPTEGVKWAADMPGPSAATPAVWGDSVFVSSANFEAKELLAMCLDRKTGQVKWKHQVGTGYRPGGMGTEVRLDDRSNYASPSPVTDGKRVVFFYGNGDMATYDFAGQKLWTRNIQKDFGDFNFGWTFSTSPQLWEGKLYMQILQRDIPVSGRGRDNAPSYLLALDPATGKELWRADRPSPARMESREAFTTPIPYVHNGQKLLLLAGGNELTGHDPANGKELWRWGTWNVGHNHPTLRLVPSPSPGAGVALVCAPKNFPVYAVKLGGSGVLGDAGLAWRSADRSTVTSDVPTPLFYQGRFYIASDLKKNIACVDPATGNVIWQTDLPGPSPVWASPTGADGKLYLMTLRGEVFVLDAEKGTILSSNPMATDENELRSSIAAASGNLFIRTNTKLYCIGK